MTYFGYVYLTTNLITGTKYIGMHKSSFHDPKYLGSGKILMLAIKKYGEENFKNEILHWCETAEEMCNKEVETILEHNAHISRDYYNIICTKTPILYGEDNGFYGKTHSSEVRKKLSEKNAGKTWTSERRHKHNEWIQTEDAKALHLRYSVERSGVCLSESHKQKLKQVMGSSEVREKLSKRAKEFYESDRGIIAKKRLADSCSKRFKNVEKTESHKNSISKALTGKSHYWQDSINKNPEKIKKTALKNTGSKRTDEQKLNISNAKKKYFAEHGNSRKGLLHFFNPMNPTETIKCLPEDVPENWTRGKPYKQYHSPCKQFHGAYIPGTEPENWIKGRRCK